jgi:hypothetical protein
MPQRTRALVRGRRTPAIAGLLAAIAVVLAACNPATPAPTSSPGITPPTSGVVPTGTVPASLAGDILVEPYAIVPLPLEERAYADWSDAPPEVDYPADAQGVPQYERKGRTYLHPVSAAQQGLRQLATYVETGDEVFLRRARTIADALLDAGVAFDGALWFPYEFDFALHGKPDDTLQAPWYSGMAQGQVLSLVSRIHEITGEAAYLDAARDVFESLVQLGRRSDPWVTWVEDRYLWIEEYPDDPPDHTLNGFVFAIYGIYDFYAITGDVGAERLYQAGLTTLEAHLPEFRNPGGVSHYCLAHGTLSEKYHEIHIEQLRMLSRMTGDPSFAEVADQFEADHS